MKKHLSLFILSSLILAACSSTPDEEKVEENTLAALVLEPALYQPSPEKKQQRKAAKPKLSPQQMIERYQAILEVHDDPEVIAKVRRRITDLKMVQAEREQFGSDDGADNVAENYQAIIDNYENLLASHPDQAQNEKILYQLAKAYDYQAQADKQLITLNKLTTQFPQSDYYLEAQFRRGDILYGRKEYRQAQQAYKAVIDGGDASRYYLNARYMHGWCLFKLNFYEPAAISFTDVLDKTLAETPLEELDSSRKALVNDTLRIMSVIFSYLDNGESIAQLYDEIGRRPYEAVLYQKLSELLLERQLHQNAIATYNSFIKGYPLHSKAPEFQLAIINTYEKARYFQQIRPARDVFIQTYGRNSDYWQQADDKTRDYIQQHIRLHLDDMAAYHHARGQALLKRKKLQQANEELAMASDYYLQWIAFYPDDDSTPEKAFLLGESLFEQQQYLSAVSWYEKSAYHYTAHEHAEEAAYAAIVSHKAHIQTLPTVTEEEQQSRDNALREKLASQQRYVGRFATDKKAPQVQLNIAQTFFELKDYQDAISASQAAFSLNAPYSQSDIKALHLIQANSAFELLDYAAAEVSYQQAIKLVKPGAKEHGELIESIAASIYKQAEQAVAAEQMDIAINHFQRVGKVTPTAKIVVTADYDAATYLLLEERWQDAVTALKTFRSKYPEHKFVEDIPGKLITAYEGLEDWEKAAGVLRQVWKTAKDPEKQRQALFLAAEYYEKAGNTDKALDSYRSYAHRYPEPFDLALETRFKLSQMYLQKKDVEKRAYWLKKLITAEKQQSNQRSRYLAAFATKELAEKDFVYYQSLKLTVPLNKSLKKKQLAFKRVIDQYKKIDDYSVAEFSTFATHKVAEIYKGFGQAMLEAEKPKGLSELELEQYDILLEEQAYPFEEEAIVIFESNTTRSWQGVYDDWVKDSFEALKTLMPGRYNKPEQLVIDDEQLF